MSARTRRIVGVSIVVSLAGVSALVLSRRSTESQWNEVSQPSAASVRVQDIVVGYDSAKVYSGVDIRYPYDGAVFPPDGISPTIAWSFTPQTAPVAPVDTWLLRFDFESGDPVQTIVASNDFTPDEDTWTTFKSRSAGRPARMTVLGVAAKSPGTILAGRSITLATSTDPVAAPLFYREVPLPFIDAVKNPARIRWRFGSIDSRTPPPVVLENLPVCGNCHSFSRDGRVLAMDVDYANDKGSYALLETAPEMVLSKDKIISWSNFRKNDKQPTFGLLSQISPDGRYAVSTVKDRSVFVPKPDISFSQLFFPLKGILAVYDREKGTYQSLPGADDPKYVQSNPVWSPDGKYIVFARSKAYELKYLQETGTALLKEEDCQEFLKGGKTFQYDLYRIPFNSGKGGKAVPLLGAAENGKSNFFAKYSPNGKWIVFCQARSFMLLQPDSELYIIPAEGGDARRLDCNTNLMNSWHSWSPNSKWLVFASKANTPYTQLFLTHVDDQGMSTPPILLSQLSAPNRAVNIPEFVNLAPDAISHIGAQFVDDSSYVRTAQENVRAQDPKHAIEFYRKALSVNPDNAEAHASLAGLLIDANQLQETQEHLERALRLDPTNVDAHYFLGNSLAKQNRYEEALQAWKKVIDLDPKHSSARNNLGGTLLGLGRVPEAEKVLQAAIVADPNNASAHHNLGIALSRLGRTKEAVQQWQRELRLDGNNFQAYENIGEAMLDSGDVDEAIKHLETALRINPKGAQSMLNLGIAYDRKGDTARSIQVTERAAQLARMTRQEDLAQECQRRLLQYKSKEMQH